MNSIIDDISHLSNQDVCKLATSYVTSQLKRIGAIVKKVENIRGRNFIIANNKKLTHEISIIVKSRRKRIWHASIDDGRLCKEQEDESNYWVFVDLTVPKSPDYFVIPDWWIRNNIYETHQAYLEDHGGRRPGNQNSKHSAVLSEHIKQWKNRWDILGI
jgi:hypothetical protein